MITGIWARSAKRAISAPAPDQNAPLPATMTGRSAAASAATSRADVGGRSRAGAGSRPGSRAGPTSSGCALPYIACGVDLEVDRSGAAAAGSVQRLRNVAGYPPGLRAARRPLRDRRRDGSLVDVHRPPRGPAGCGSVRPASITIGTLQAPASTQADQAVGESRARGHGRDAGVAGGQRPSLGGEHRSAFVTRVDDPDVLVDARVEKWEDVPAGEREDGGDATLAERSRDQRAAVRARGGARAVESLGRDVRHGFAVYRPVSSAGTVLDARIE